MSSSTPHSTEPHAASEDSDGVNIKKIITIGAVSLAIFAISAVVAALIMHGENKQYATRGLAPPPSELGKDEIGLVDQVEFSQDRRLDEWKAAKRKRLDSYGWVDRSKNLVHIPIEKAIDQVVTQAGAP
jgi:hypothetical protein